MPRKNLKDNVCNRYVAEDFTKVVIALLQKKQNATECQIITSTLHTSILLHILTIGIKSKENDFMGKTRFGFRKGCYWNDENAM